MLDLNTSVCDCVRNPAARFCGSVSYRYILHMFYINIDQKSITIR